LVVICKVKCSSWGDPLLLYKILHLLFFPLIRFFLIIPWDSKKYHQNVFDAGLLEFQFLRPREKSHQPIKNSIVLFRSHRKTPGLISHNNFVKNFLSASAIAIRFLQDVTRSSFCSGAKECGTKRTHNILFPKSFSESEELQSWGYSKILLSFLLRFDGHLWPTQQQQPC